VRFLDSARFAASAWHHRQAMTTVDHLPARAAPVVHHAGAGTDPDQFRDQMELGFEGTRWRVSPTEEPFSWRQTYVGDADLGLSAIRVVGEIAGTSQARCDHVVSWLRSGRPLDLEGPDVIRSGLGTPTLFATDRPTRMGYVDFDQRCVHLSKESVRRAAAARGVAAPGVLARRDVPADPAGLERWWKTLSLITGVVGAPGTSAVLRAEAVRMTAEAFLDLFPSVSTGLPPELLLPRNAHLRAAVEHVHEYAHLPIGSDDLAAAAGIGVRALQQAFLRHLGLTPTAYLRQVRLERVRDALLVAEPSTTMVADVARAWGFAHLGRFAASYVQHLGEYPRQTLARTR